MDRTLLLLLLLLSVLLLSQLAPYTLFSLAAIVALAFGVSRGFWTLLGNPR